MSSPDPILIVARAMARHQLTKALEGGGVAGEGSPIDLAMAAVASTEELAMMMLDEAAAAVAALRGAGFSL